jgi:pyrrolidone-carboxylate peptidase
MSTIPSCQRKKVIVMTGFGAFGSVLTNPTKEMIEYFTEHMKSFSYLTKDNIEENIPVIYQVLEVSAEACEEFFQKTLQKLKDLNTAVCKENEILDLYFIHLGIDANASMIKLERYGYNNKSFRIPDTRGYQPMDECINNLNEFNFPLPTPLPVDTVLQNVLFNCTGKALLLLQL